MTENFKHRSSASVDVRNVTKELLGNNEYAIEAIRSRNIKIKNLENIIKHQIIAFREIEKRYEEISENKNKEYKTRTKIEKDYSELYKEWKNISGELKVLKNEYHTLKEEYELIKALKNKTFTAKIENYANKVGGKRGDVLKLLLTPPVSKIFLLIVFILIFVASIVGWGPVIAAIKPIFKLFY